MDYTRLDRTQLTALRQELAGKFEGYKNSGLKLDMSRGKPAPEMVQLAAPMLDVLNSGSNMLAEDGMDTRNYGGLDGIPEVKRLFAEIMGVETSDLMVYGNSSLNLMFDTLMRGYVFGAAKGCRPLSEVSGRKWLCPVPGYDRHFAITERFGFEMINIPMNEDGPDMDTVEKMVSDPDVKGIWCVPIFSNPGGVVYSADTIDRLARLKPAAKDFRIYFDNAYSVHAFDRRCKVSQPNMLAEAKKFGSENMVYIFTSTSKISFAGGGVSAMASGAENLQWQRKLLGYQTIGHDKVNQLRHARFFRDAAGVAAHMDKYMSLLIPKFNTVLASLEKHLSGTGVAEWSRPKGGYFISVDLLPGCASRTVALCAEAGLKVTPAGAAFPYGIDPADSHLRIAPSYPTIAQLEPAGEIFCSAASLAAVERLLG